MHALPAGPGPAPRNQALVGATLGSVAMVMLAGGMIAVWLVQRTRTEDLGESWLPDGVTVPEVPSNVLLLAFAGLCVFGQWAYWSVVHRDRGHGVLAYGCVGLMALLIINGQAFIYNQMGVAIDDGAYGAMFYSITGVFIALMVVGMAFTVVLTFRLVGGRADRDLAAAHALYWYTVAAVYAGIWFVVYVLK